MASLDWPISQALDDAADSSIALTVIDDAGREMLWTKSPSYATIGIPLSTGEAQRPKPLFWMGSTHKDLKAFPPEVRQAAGFALFQAQMGRKHVDAKVLKGFGGAGVLEVVSDHDGDTYRTVYTVRLAGAVYALHAFQKKSKEGIKTPPPELGIVRTRLKAAEEHHAKRTAEENQSRGSSHD